MSASAGRAREVNARGEGARLREEITAAAARLLAASAGRDGVTLRAIAREARIAAPSVYLHFADRDAVLDAVVSDTFHRLDDACRSAAEGAGSGADRVARICRAYLDFAREHPGEYRVLFERGPADISEPPHPYPAGLAAFGMLSDAIRRMAEEGVPGLRPERDAQSLWLVLHGLATLVPATPGFPWTDPEALLDDALDRLRAGRRAAAEPQRDPIR